MSSGVWGFMTIVSASNQLFQITGPNSNIGTHKAYRYPAERSGGNSQDPFQSLALWLRQLRDHESKQIRRFAPRSSRSSLPIMFRQVRHQLLRRDMVYIPVDVILNLMGAQRLMDDGVIERVRRDGGFGNPWNAFWRWWWWISVHDAVPNQGDDYDEWRAEQQQQDHDSEE